MPRKKKTTTVHVDMLSRKDCVDKGCAWAQDYPLNLFSGDADECKFTRDDLRSSFIAGIKQYLQTIWHDANTELPNAASGVCFAQQAVSDSLHVERCNRVYTSGGSWTTLCMMAKGWSNGRMSATLCCTNSS